MNLVQDFFRNATTRAKLVAIGIILILLIMIVVVVIAFIMRISKTKLEYIKITNFPTEVEGEAIPNTHKAKIEGLIWDNINDNYKLDQSEPIEAIVREDMITKDRSRHTLLIDIPKLHYTFRVSFNSVPDDNIKPDYVVECPYADEIVYWDTRCPIGSAIDQVKRYLPMPLTTSGGNDIYTKIETYADYQRYANEQYLAVYVDSCGDKSIVKEAEKVFRKKLKEYALDPNDYHIEMMDVCNN